MDKIYTKPKMSKMDNNCMFLEIKLNKKGEYFRARTSTLLKINNSNKRPEALSKISYENAIDKLIPKIEKSLIGTNKKIGNILRKDADNIVFEIEEIIYEKPNSIATSSPVNPISLINNLFELLSPLMSLNTSNTDTMNIVSDTTINNISSKTKISLKEIIIELQQELYMRTKKSYDDEDYISPNTLETRNRNLWSFVFPYLEQNPEYDNIYTFSEKNVDEILNMTKSRESQKIILLILKLAFNHAINKNYIKDNPIANKKLKKIKRKKNKESYDFIEEDDRALWIDCMLKDINFKSNYHKKNDASLAFLFMLLHGSRPEEICGLRWIDIDFHKNDYFVQNAFKSVPIYDEKTMKRTGWIHENGPLKTPESYRHIPLDILIKDFLKTHKKNQKKEFKENGRKWSEKEHIFLNSSRKPFVPKVLSRNFIRFRRRNNLPELVLYGLRHSFATHCRALGMPPEVLAPLMGHTEYETTQKYYVHVSTSQKKEELQKIQQKDIQNLLTNNDDNLIHLQENIINLKKIQKENTNSIVEIHDETLSTLKLLIKQLNNKTTT